MAEIKWIKITTDIFNNRKIRQLECMPDGDALIVIWLKLLILAGNINDGGCIYFTKDIAFTDQLLADQFNRPIATVQLALATFQRFGMIEIVDEIIHISNWERYQNIEGMERIREQNRLRKQRQRERERLLLDSGDVTSRDCHATDKNRIDKNREEKNRDNVTAKRFSPPSVDDVRAYCIERNNNIDPEHFVDYYAVRGWELTKGRRMKDWKAAIRTWERNGYSKPKKGANGVRLAENKDHTLDGIL